MIKRYSRPELVKVWSQQEKYRIWFEIEAYACEAMEGICLIPKGTTKNVLKASGIDYDIDENTTIFDDSTKNELINPPVIDGIQDFVNNFEQLEKYLHQKQVDKMYEDIIEDFGDPVAAYIPEKVEILPLKHTVG